MSEEPEQSDSSDEYYEDRHRTVNATPLNPNPHFVRIVKTDTGKNSIDYVVKECACRFWFQCQRSSERGRSATEY
jgi:hypothetical protein